jgi:hypothetical protein
MPYSCTVVYSNDCDGLSNTECFACGQPACKGCTVMIWWFGNGVRRIGMDCAREEISYRIEDFLGVELRDEVRDEVCRRNSQGLKEGGRERSRCS